MNKLPLRSKVTPAKTDGLCSSASTFFKPSESKDWETEKKTQPCLMQLYGHLDVQPGVAAAVYKCVWIIRFKKPV